MSGWVSKPNKNTFVWYIAIVLAFSLILQGLLLSYVHVCTYAIHTHRYTANVANYVAT